MTTVMENKLKIKINKKNLETLWIESLERFNMANI